MAQEQTVAVRRAKPRDADRIAAFIQRASGSQSGMDKQAMLERLGSVGLLLAERDGELVGMLGWQVENLVVRVTDFLVWPAVERAAAGGALFSAMEEAAVALECEVALLFPPRPTPPALVEFCGTLGYEPRVVANLAKAWREAALEFGLGVQDTVLAKPLRSDRVLRPL